MKTIKTTERCIIFIGRAQEKKAYGFILENSVGFSFSEPYLNRITLVHQIDYVFDSQNSPPPQM